jgi:hypothetical protein
MLPELSYEEVLVKCNLKTLEGRRQDMCRPINLFKSMLDPGHKLHELLPPKVCEIRNRETRLSGDYNFSCRTERFKNSAIVYGVEQYNSNNS